MNPITATAGILTNLKDWAAQPFNSQQDATHWAYFTGLIIVLALLWFMVLREITKEI